MGHYYSELMYPEPIPSRSTPKKRKGKKAGKTAKGKIPALLEAISEAELMLKVADCFITHGYRIGYASPCHERLKKIRRALAKARKSIPTPNPNQKAEK